MARECSYDCSNLPATIESDTDITGLGVVIGYVGAAGIAVTLISCHYIMAYSPDLDPFRDANGVPSRRDMPFRPNPVDLMILRCIKGPFRSLSEKSVGALEPSTLDTRFTKAILTMSDLQLATGIAILISGYSQLRCGLSAYHWLIVTRLAWFSSLTHLSCLTLLRNYLYIQKAKRQWRLFFMFALVVMLVTAMVPTGSFDDWRSYGRRMELPPMDYAICLFSKPVIPRSVETLVSMVLLVCLIVFGLAFRVIKLYRPLSSFLAESLRHHISQGMRRLLWTLYRSRTHHGGSRKFAGYVLYYPALASFLAMRLCADHFASMFFEVYWLVWSFLIGLLSLLKYLNLILPRTQYYVMFDGSSQNSWSFGQVMPVLLLAVPLTNILESLYPVDRKQTENKEPEIQVNTPTPPSNDSLSMSFSYNLPLVDMASTTPSSSNLPKFDPDYNYYNETSVMKAANVYFFICELGISGVIVFISLGNDAVMAARALNLGLLGPPVGLVTTILISLRIDHRCRGKGSSRRVTALHTVNVVFMLLSTAAFLFLFTVIISVGY
ncbi:hypothetical protein BDV06DRAFT_226298 [Aspergillus oleicola]